MVLDGDNDNAIPVATELDEDLDATVVGVGTSAWSRLLRSRHCEVGATTVPSTHPDYPERILELVREYDPDLLVPIGYHSVAAANAVRDRLPESVACWLPPADSLAVAVDKSATASLAADLGVGTPTDFTSAVTDLDARGRPGEIGALPFPVFLKARHECGDNVTASVSDPSRFWETYDELREQADDEVIVQERIESEHTYACGLLYEHGSPRLQFAHEELRSVPRSGGTGTRVRVFRDPHMETAAIRLLDHLSWHGPALVEFKRRTDGSYALMEVNPKFWASYALASQSGYRFVSTLAARALGREDSLPRRRPDLTGECVFPLRDLYHAATTGDESVLRAAASMCWPPAAVDVNHRDLGAWLTPPVAILETLDPSRSASSSECEAGARPERASESAPRTDGSDGESTDWPAMSK